MWSRQWRDGIKENVFTKKPPIEEVFYKRGKKVVLQKLASNGDSGIGKKFNTSIGFAMAIKGIKNGKVRIK